MSKNVKKVDMKVWIDEHAAVMAKENIKILKMVTKNKGFNATNGLITRFLGEYVSQMLNHVLDISELADLDEEEQYEVVSNRFASMKLEIQNEVADAFKVTLYQHSGKSIDYYVSINLVPEPISEAIN